MKKRKIFGKFNNLSKKSYAFLLSDSEITVYECEKIEFYSKEKVVLKTIGGNYEITGSNLSVSTCFGREISVRGSIETVKPPKNTECKKEKKQ